MDDKDRRIIEMYTEGLALKEIGAALKCTGASVSNRVNRLIRGGKLKGRGSARPTSISGFPGTTTVMDAVSALKRDECRWPIGDTREKDFHFCRAKVTIKGARYCDEHRSIALTKCKYTPKKEWNTVKA